MDKLEPAKQAREEGFSYEQYLAETLAREREERRKDRIERLLRVSGLPVEKSLESIDREKAAGKGKCSTERFLGRRLSRSNRECADFGNLGFFYAHPVDCQATKS